MNRDPLVHLGDICKSFGEHLVLDRISLGVRAGRGLCVCGPNAAGKSTLLRIAAGLLRPAVGTVRICGFDARDEPEKARAGLGVIFHKSMVYPHLTVIENLRFFARLYGLARGSDRIQSLLQRTALAPYRHDRAAILSRGMRQRLSIARALIHEPAVLLADEPLTGLDADAARLLVETLTEFKNAARAFVMTTHNVRFALDCCDDIAVLDGGRLILHAPVDEIDRTEFARDYLSYARAVN